MNMKSKNAPEELKKLHDNRALVLLVELMGFLHDVGKLDEELYNEHYKRYDEDKKLTVENAKNGYAKVPESIIKLFEEKFGKLLDGKIEDEVKEKVKNCEIRGFQRHHSDKEEEYRPQNWLEEIINLADDKDSSEDRGKAIHKQKEFIASVFGKEKKFFNTEKENSLHKQREKFYHEIPKQKIADKLFKLKNGNLSEEEWEVFHQSLTVLIKEYFIRIPAFTKRAANDVTLFDHSFMTGSIAKALVGKALLNEGIRERFIQQIEKRKAEKELIRQDYPEKEIKINKKIIEPYEEINHFNDECDLSLVIISFDGFGFISHGINLLDLRGRKLLLEIIREEIKSLLEVEYPFGNCIYEDENNLCFLNPLLKDESFNFVEREIQRIFNEKTSGLLIPVIERSRELKYYGEELISMKKDAEGKTRQNFMSNLGDFKPKWFEKWKGMENKDKCVLCGKMPQYEGKGKDNLCEFCYNLRHLKDKSMDRTEDSPWLDEIADENGKIAVIAGTFHPVDRWLSGEFLNYQKIKGFSDLRYKESLDYENTIRIAADNFVSSLNKVKEDESILKGMVSKLLDRKESYTLGGGSKVGEFYGRLSEDSRKNLEKEELGYEEKAKIAKELIEISTTKPHSPSRLHRIWRELQNFSDEVIKYSSRKMPEGKRLKFKLDKFEGEEGIYKAEIEGIGRIEVLHEGNGKFFVIERIDKNNPSDEVEDSYLKKHEQIIEEAKRNKKISVFKDRIKLGEFGAVFEKEKEYKQFREILSSPNGFMFVLPAKKAFEVVRDIKEQFEMEFSKALGKLSLNLGIVVSHRKSPIYVSLDAARRFREEFKVEDEEGYISVEKQHLCETPESTNGEHPYRYLVMPIRVKGKEIFWKVEHTLGDGRIDRYHPYFVSSDDKLLHITEMTFKDKLRVYLNYFDFEYLDTTVRRFDIVLGGDKKRTHTIIDNEGPRPYLLEDLYKFERLREIFEAIGSWTPIRDVEALAASKREDWAQSVKFEDVSEEYEELVESMLENKLSCHFDKENWRGNIKEFLKECIMEGSFFDAIELFKSIMKMDLRGDVE